MDIGLIGLGKMGANMRQRLRDAGHTVYGYARSPELRDVDSLEALVAALPAPRVVWVMIPAGDPTRQAVETLGELLAAKGIGYLDCGVSGGVWGLKNGYALMVGGDPENVAKVKPAFDALKPAGESGFVHAGPVGAGHFAKMVHNGIEYGMMQAYAEGFELLQASEVVEDVPGVLRSWTQGTVVRSWLLDLLVLALEEDPKLDAIKGYVNDSGEGRWTVEEAINHSVPMPVISAALFARFASRQADSPAMKAVAALRNQFGGHAVTAASEVAADAGAGGAGPTTDT